MINGKRFLAHIPARGGSKRLPNKNILDLGGKPLIAWTIEAALQCAYIDRVIVSTDSHKIASISKRYGADIPFIRPSELASDEARGIDAIIYAINSLESVSDSYDYIVQLQPTSPLRTSSHITNAIDFMIGNHADAVMSVCKTSHNPLWCNTLPTNKDMSGFIPEKIKNKDSRELPSYYRLNGAIAICCKKRVLKEKTFFIKSNFFAFQMNEMESVDIDTEMDLKFASFLMDYNKII